MKKKIIISSCPYTNDIYILFCYFAEPFNCTGHVLHIQLLIKITRVSDLSEIISFIHFLHLIAKQLLQKRLYTIYNYENGRFKKHEPFMANRAARVQSTTPSSVTEVAIGGSRPLERES
jgi:hypothetical protein